MMGSLQVRRASMVDLDAVGQIYNQGVEDRIATLETTPKTADDIKKWWAQHDQRYAVLVAAERGMIVGWASLNRSSHGCAGSDVADLSVYVERANRGRGIGAILLIDIERKAVEGKFHKLVLYALDENDHGKRLYQQFGFTHVGIFKEHGLIDQHYVDVVAMEKLLVL